MYCVACVWADARALRIGAAIVVVHDGRTELQTPPARKPATFNSEILMENAIRLAIAVATGCALGACNEPTSMPSPTVGAPSTSTEQVTTTTTAPSAPQPSALLEDPGADDGAKVTRAVAILQPTRGSKVHGTVTFTQGADGKVKVKAEVSGLPEGVHAYHVHQFGDCSSGDGKSAGTHFNFAGSSEHPGDNIDRITGNLGELQADAQGKASDEAAPERASLQGAYSLIGRAVIVHEKGNDPKQPPIGAAGSRLACGVIGVADAKSQQAKAPGSTGATRGG